MAEPFKIGISCWNYGGNFTTGGLELSRKSRGINNTLYGGLGLNTGKNGAQFGGVVDYRANVPVYKNDNLNVSTGLRIRTKLFENSQSTETRAQLNFGGNFNKNLGWYATAYGRTTINWQDGTNKETAGVFGGLSYATSDGKIKFSGEGQLDNKNGFSVNFGAFANISPEGKQKVNRTNDDVILKSYDN